MILDPVRTPATATDMLVFPRKTRVRAGEAWLEISTPEYPTYHDGNGLVLASPPATGSLPAWRARWRSAFEGVSGIQQESYGWELPDPEAPSRGIENPAAWPEAQAAGFSMHVLVAQRLAEGAVPDLLEPALPVRRLAGDRDWAGQRALVERLYPGSPAFIRWHSAAYRDLVQAGRGGWLGAFDGEQLVASAGLFWSPEDPQGPARYQEVVTHPDYRRRGLASAILVRLAHEYAAGRSCVIVSDPDEPATALYRGLGFVPVTTQVSATLDLR